VHSYIWVKKKRGRAKCIISLSGTHFFCKTTYTLFLLRNMAEIQLELVNLKGEQTSTIRRWIVTFKYKKKLKTSVCNVAWRVLWGNEIVRIDNYYEISETFLHPRYLDLPSSKVFYVDRLKVSFANLRSWVMAPESSFQLHDDNRYRIDVCGDREFLWKT